MKVNSLREMTRDELQQRKIELEEEVFNLNMRRSLKQLDNPLRMRGVGREIAKVLTVLREDELGINKLAERKISVLDSSKKDSKEK
ncbi:MAG: 50S ribosomal protein L29 [Candidatus Zixiibacteriota bacterium]|nr:MAG: 50S ribosomal protein L29 [candidate division Zixibacteria bacterium]